MKKKLFILIVAAIASFSLFAYSCGEKNDDTVYPSDVNRLKEITLSYDASSGTLSWQAVENAENYKVTIAPHLGDPVEKETDKTFCFVSLKRGVNRAVVYAYDTEKNALAVGSESYSLDYDYGAPAAPENIVFDATTKTLGWNAVPNATRYCVSATSFADETFLLEKHCENNEISLEEIGRGIYYFTVYGISADGAEGIRGELAYRSFIDKNEGSFTADGLRYLLGFADENVEDITKKSSWQAWGSKDDIGVIADKSAEEILTEIEKNETLAENVKRSYLNRLNAAINGKNAARKSGKSFYSLLQGDKKGFAGVTFNLGREIKTEELRNVSLTTYFTTGDSLDLVLGDGVNTVYVKLDPSHVGTWLDFDVLSEDFNVKDSMPETITQISLVTHCANPYSGYLIGDISYGLKSDVGKALYDAKNSEITWSAADGATSYNVFVDGKEAYSGKECGFVYPLSSGKHEIRIIADNGTESEQVIEGLTFDFGEEKRVLADFGSLLYSEYISNAPTDYSIDTATGALVKNVSSGTWRSGSIKYSFPKEIKLSAIKSLSFKIKTDNLENVCLYLADEAGNTVYVYYADEKTKSAGVSVSEKDENGFVVLTVNLRERLAEATNNNFDGNSTVLKGVYLGARKDAEITFGEISYNPVGDPVGENFGGARTDWGW